MNKRQLKKRMKYPDTQPDGTIEYFKESFIKSLRKAARTPKEQLKSFSTVEDLMKDLNSPD
jgi:hypothetical protein